MSTDRYPKTSLELEINRILLDKGLSITTAESCTGGLVAGTLINADGISACLKEGFITYSNEAKSKYLGVQEETLRLYGAVSEQTAKEMAEGAARAAEADVAIVTTGIAGPGGGTPEKPVGLVYIGCTVCGNTVVKRCQFSGDRQEVRHSAVEEALRILHEHLLATTR